MTRFRMIFATALMVTAASLAHADTISDARLSQSVQFGDLNLSHRQGAETLYKRLQIAAKSVCAPLDGRDLNRHSKFQSCVKEAVAAAVADVDQPLLTQVHRSRDSLTVAQASIALRH